VRKELFAEVTFHASYEPMRCVRTDRYKLIRLYDDHEGHVPSNIDEGNSKTFVVDAGLLESKRDKEMLFDLYLDPIERVNVKDEPRYNEVYKDMADRLDKWMSGTADPLLQGKVQKPPGAKINKLSSLHPGTTDYEE
jgi:hypothetical protein